MGTIVENESHCVCKKEGPERTFRALSIFRSLRTPSFGFRLIIRIFIRLLFDLRHSDWNKDDNQKWNHGKPPLDQVRFFESVGDE